MRADRHGKVWDQSTVEGANVLLSFTAAKYTCFDLTGMCVTFGLCFAGFTTMYT